MLGNDVQNVLCTHGIHGWNQERGEVQDLSRDPDPGAAHRSSHGDHSQLAKLPGMT